ncbi:expressed unknown protein [Seminavis robusta]|uniref:Uncharacterized protein n=1 Tax=Seminavis robusta TaxID=568900 RepID=A0A9N8E1K0_9STRA|nr:expressed unknown protein [Seminavis robusta]|eukprot:Sro413_g138180.1 n/a (606) ;mRNA; r:56540-58357
MASLLCPRLRSFSLILLLVGAATQCAAFTIPVQQTSTRATIYSRRNERFVHYFWRGLDKTEEDDEAVQNKPVSEETKGKRKRDRLKTDFDRLFLGSPSMQDILSGNSNNSNNIGSKNPVDDESWFEEEKKEIESYYQRIYDQMAAELADQRLHDPRGVPSNAEEMLRGVLMEEMKMEIETKKKASLGIDDPQNEVVADLSAKRRSVVRKKSGPSRVQEYKQYEFDAVPKAGGNDEWSLDKLQKELQSRLEEEEDKAANGPETMKEWQMWQSFSSKAGILKEAQEEITDKYQSWKDYIAKEEAMRKEAGLARGPKLPFAWQEAERDQAKKEAERLAAIQNEGRVKSHDEIREEINEKSIVALEQLIRTTKDPSRSARMQNTLLTLQQELEVCRLDDSGTCEEELEEAIQNELSSASDLKKELQSSGKVFITPSDLSFSDAYDDDYEEERTLPEPTTPPPKTSFFSQDDDEDGSEEPASTKGEGRLGYSLGTIEEQKLRAQFQKAGAKTTEEKEAFRAQWEDFQKYEKSVRDESGLSDNSDSDSAAEDDDGIDANMADYTNEDGEFDAAKILASIGPRPTRRKRKGNDGRGPGRGASDRTEDDETSS